MKSLIAVAALLITTSSQATLVCHLSKLGAVLSVEQTSPGKYGYTYISTKTLPETGAVLQVLNPSREDMATDPTLKPIMRKAGFTQSDQFIGAQIYITNSNSVGSSGLVVFTGAGFGLAKSGSAAMVYFNAANYAEKCK